MDHADISDGTLVDMVRDLRPAWEPRAITPIENGVNATSIVDVETPDGSRTVVLKASTSSHPLADDRARAEPRVLSLLDRETAIPVPTVLGARPRHERLPAPFFLMSYVDGTTFDQKAAPGLPPDVRETVFREAGQHLAELHALGPLSAVGDLVG